MPKSQAKFNTLAIHAGYDPKTALGSCQVPIYQTSAYIFDDADDAAGRFGLEKMDNIYTRVNNPTNTALEERLAALEGGIGATVAATGLGGQLLCFTTLMQPGDEVVASNRLYGGSFSQLKHTFPRHFGWNTQFVDMDDMDAVKAALNEKTKVIYAESIANPGGVITDIEALAKIAHEHAIPLVIDNTIATPYLCRPIDFGADIVVHSTTKFLNSNCSAMGGVVIDSGNFDWGKSGKFPNLTDIETSYNLAFHDKFRELAFTMFGHAVMLRDLGPSQAPMNSFLTLLGIETLHLRMQRHVENAQRVAEFLEKHEGVEWVSYAGLPSSKYKKLADKYMPKGAGSVFTFGVKGGYEAGRRIMESVELFSLLANIGDTRSLIIHPASTTHRQLNEEAQRRAGIGPEVLRVSIGVEDVDDIIADLDQALKGAGTKAAA